MVETGTVKSSAVLTTGLELRGGPRQIAGLENVVLDPGTTAPPHEVRNVRLCRVAPRAATTRNHHAT